MPLPTETAMSDAREILRSFPFFAALPEDATAFLLEQITPHSLGSDELVCRQGDPGDGMYFISSGSARVVVQPDDSDVEIEVAKLGAGDYFGEISLLTGEPRSASVITAGPAQIFFLPKVDFDEVVAQFPEITLGIGQTIGRRLRATLQKALSAPTSPRGDARQSGAAVTAQGAGAASPVRNTGGGAVAIADEDNAGVGASLNTRVEALLGRDDLDSYLEQRPAESQSLLAQATAVAERAFQARDPSALFEAHRTLYVLYEEQVRPAGAASFNQDNPLLMGVRNALESHWERYELGRTSTDADEVPAEPEAFARYFDALCERNSLADHPLFDFLEHRARRADFVAFFLSDAAVIIRFCDLVVLSMVGADDAVRGELAENFWDEMGHGRAQERHIHLFGHLLEYVGVDLPDRPLSVDDFVGNLDSSGLAGYNFYLFLCLNRRNQLRSLGALGAAEGMDPPQYTRVLAGCRRVGFDEEAGLAYYASHESMDVKHGDQWLKNVLLPLVRAYPDRRQEIVVGAKMRFNITRDYYDGLAARFARD